MSSSNHSWSENDAALVDGKIYRVMAVTGQNVPAIEKSGRLVLAQSPEEWNHVGHFKWVWLPKGKWKFVAA